PRSRPALQGRHRPHPDPTPSLLPRSRSPRPRDCTCASRATHRVGPRSSVLVTSTRVAAYEDTLQEELEAIGLWSLIQDPTLTDVIVSADGTIHTHGFDGPS